MGDTGNGSPRPVSATSSAPGAIQPDRVSAATAGATKPCPQGGSRNTRLQASAARGGANASPAITRTLSSARQVFMFVRSVAIAALSRSMKLARAAPRESASNPNAPLPAKASRTIAPSNSSGPPQEACISMSNSA